MLKALIVGEAWGEREALEGKPFAGASGHILRGLLDQTGWARGEYRLTNVFNEQPADNKIESFTTTETALGVTSFPHFKPRHYVRKDKFHHVERLIEEVKLYAPTIIIALGSTPLWALAHRQGVAKWRGSPMSSAYGPKLICTWAPSAILRQWDLRPVAFMDLLKARREAEFPEVRRPERFIILEPTLEDIETFYHEHVVPASRLSVDIETKSGQITEIGFATSPSRALVIPFYSRSRINYWPSVTAELTAWKWVRRFLAEKPTIGQNFQYDMQYLWRTLGIPCPRFEGDTMLLHHALQPELKKGLGFLGSIYTDEPAWKFMRSDNATLKKEDE